MINFLKKNYKKILIFIILILAAVLALAYFYSTSSFSWNKAMNAALKEEDCPKIEEPKYGDKYYNGPLIDTHYHFPDLFPLAPNEVIDYPDPVLGSNLTISQIDCNLERENTKKAFVFFPVYPEFWEQHIEFAKRVNKEYPERFELFIMPPDDDGSPDGFPTVNAEFLDKMLRKAGNIFKGYGEIGLYGREDGAGALPPDSKRLREIYPVVRENKLAVYFHLGEGMKDSYQKILAENRNINFIFHGDQLIPTQGELQDFSQIEEIIKNNPNVYYTIDELYGNQWMIHPEKTKEDFFTYLGDYERLLEYDLQNWKPLIEKYPDQFMWGTDRSDQVVWSHEPDFSLALANYSRAFIAGLDPAVQEKFAYKNAEKVLVSQ